MKNPLDWTYLTTPPSSTDVLDVFAIGFLALFLGGFVLSTYLYYRPWTKPVGTYFRRKAVIKATGIGMWIFGTGLFFFLIRLLQINPLTFGEPIWMWLSVVAVVAFLGMVLVSLKSALAGNETSSSRGRTGAPAAQPVRRPVRRKTTTR